MTTPEIDRLPGFTITWKRNNASGRYYQDGDDRCLRTEKTTGRRYVHPAKSTYCGSSFPGSIDTTLGQIKDATAKIEELADVRTQSMDDVDSLLRVYNSGIQSGELAVGQKEALDRSLREVE
ncbi:hypothetical protein EDD17DRAFT_1511386 [Pisolithus thermaeus]|nr:hypothetical protein EDD17DRAFT_1511386 [Pisolithus thermaeus]